MIFSKKHAFVFVKGKKVAGTSVEMALSTVCGPRDIITPITPVDEIARLEMGGRGAQNYTESRQDERKYLKALLSAPPEKLAAIRPLRTKFQSHMSIASIQQQIGDLPSGRIFAVERNPYAKIISSANSGRNLKLYKASGKPMLSDAKVIENIVDRRLAGQRLQECRNIERYCDANGELIVRIICYENLEQEFAALMAEFRISPAPKLPHAKPGVNANSFDPREVLRRDQLDDINELFADEFERFGYECI